MACLDPPFIGDNLIVLGNNIVKGKPKPLPSQYSENLSKFIDRMLSKRPEKRPTAREALELIPKDIIEKIKLAKQNNIEIKTRPFSSVGNRVITYNKEETQNVELQPIKEEKKKKENNIVNQGNKNEVKQQFETKGNNNYSKKPQSLNTNIKANELSSILLDQKKPKPIEISIEEKIVDNSKEPKLSNSNVNIFSVQSFSTIVLKSTTSPSISAHVAILANPSLIFLAISITLKPSSTSNSELSFNLIFIIIFLSFFYIFS